MKSGRFVFRLRTLTKLTQGNFAEKLGFTRPYISQLENNVVDISLSTFIEWCTMFEINPMEIFNEKQWK